MVERIAHRVGHRFSPFAEFVAVRGCARDELLGDAVDAHGAPLVMVAVEPYTGDVVEGLVIGHLLGRQVVMIIDDGHVPRELVIKAHGGFVGQQEVFVEKGFHYDFSYIDLEMPSSSPLSSASPRSRPMAV